MTHLFQDRRSTSEWARTRARRLWRLGLAALPLCLGSAFPGPARGEPVIRSSVEAWDQGGYREALQDGILRWEEVSGRRLEPGPKRSVGLKLYTGSGPGLQTSPELVRALVAFLEERGFKREEMVLFDASRFHLRRSGFLPPLSANRFDFEGVPVRSIEDPGSTHADWYYESALPSDLGPRYVSWDLEGSAWGRERRSLLPAYLLFEVDFWINLPVAVDHPVLGLSGALINGTLWNVGNRERFFRSELSGSAAAAEIAAIPELRETWWLTILSLETFQFIGGPRFNAHYSRSFPEILMGEDPVKLDQLVLEHMNEARDEAGFAAIETDLPQFRFYRTLFPVGEDRPPGTDDDLEAVAQ